jgi:rare lipoprotein A
MDSKQKDIKRIGVFLVFACCLNTASSAQSTDAAAADSKEPAKESAQKSKKPQLDRSGKPRTGKASYYHDKFAGRKMADGTPMNPDANIAASKTLPLGTKAEVTNLTNGKSEVVEIRDRGPYVDGRIVDVSPKVAEKLGLKEDGVAPVRVQPIELPPVGNGIAAK